MTNITHEQYMRGLEAYRSDYSIRSVQKALEINWTTALELVEDGIPSKGLEPYQQIVSTEIAVIGKEAPEGGLMNANDDLKANIILYKTIQKSALDYYNPDVETKGEKITIRELKELVHLGQELAKMNSTLR